jgi:hypothetical protein
MRSKQEIRGIVGGFAQSGMTRREYCARQNIGIATLDDWRRIEKKSHPKLTVSGGSHKLPEQCRYVLETLCGGLV